MMAPAEPTNISNDSSEVPKSPNPSITSSNKSRKDYNSVEDDAQWRQLMENHVSAPQNLNLIKVILKFSINSATLRNAKESALMDSTCVRLNLKLEYSNKYIYFIVLKHSGQCLQSIFASLSPFERVQNEAMPQFLREWTLQVRRQMSILPQCWRAETTTGVRIRHNLHG